MGGGISRQLDSFKKGFESSKLDLSGAKATETSLNLDSSKSHLPSPKLNLEDKSENSLSLSSAFAEGKDSATITSSISEVHSQIGREGRVTKINQELESQYSELVQKQLEKATDRQQSHINNFHDLKRQLQGQTQSRRGKRDVTQQVSLNQAHRDAINRMFLLHNGLKEESQKLSKKLEEEFFNGLRETLLSDYPIALSYTGPATFEEIKKSLEQIDWTGTTIQTQKNRSQGSTNFYSARSWGAWEQNPFRHFYSQKEFTSDIKQLQSGAMNIHRAKQEQARLQQRSHNIWSRSRTMWPMLESQYKAINDRISALEASKDSHIVNKVATFLLKYMGQNK